MMPNNTKDLNQLLDGYARVMLIWAILRVLMSIIDVVKLVIGGVRPGFFGILAILIVIAVMGLYLGFTGHFGVRALNDSAKLKLFKIMSVVGALISGALLCLYLYWILTGLAYTQVDLFCTSVDFLLYAAGVYYAWRIEKGTN